METIMKLALRLAPIGAIGYGVSGGSTDINEMMTAAIDLAYQVKTTAEIRGIVQIIRIELINGDKLPSNLTTFVRTNMDSQGTDPAADPWGGLYQLVRTDDGGVHVLSCGPDKACDTKDDVSGVVQDSGGRFRGSRQYK